MGDGEITFMNQAEGKKGENRNKQVEWTVNARKEGKFKWEYITLKDSIHGTKRDEEDRHKPVRTIKFAIILGILLLLF